jgi:hypothetical protein
MISPTQYSVPWPNNVTVKACLMIDRSVIAAFYRKRGFHPSVNLFQGRPVWSLYIYSTVQPSTPRRDLWRLAGMRQVCRRDSIKTQGKPNPGLAVIIFFNPTRIRLNID